MMAVRGPPKKKKRTTKQASQSSIIPSQDQAPASSMSYPPRCKSSGGSNQLSIEYPTSVGQLHVAPSAATKAKVPAKVKAKRKRNDLPKDKSNLPQMFNDSPAMGTRSKRTDPASPAMSTRSKRRLSL
ncbi:unnamed protein product [Urochloa humidicola]